MTNISTQNFNGLTPPAVPSGVSSTNYETASGIGVGGSIGLRQKATITGEVFANFPDLSTSADVEVAADICVSAIGTTDALDSDCGVGPYARKATGGGALTCYFVILRGYKSVSSPAAQDAANGFALYKYVAGTPSQVGSGPIFPSGYAANIYYHTRLRCNGAIISVYVQRPSDSFYLKPDGSFQSGEIACISATDFSPIAGATTDTAGIRSSRTANATGVAQVDNYSLDTIVGVDPVLPVITNIRRIANATATVIQLVLDAPTAGDAPFTYQWYCSTTQGFTPGGGNILSGQTARTLTDTGRTPGTWYYYRCIVSNAAGSVTSYERPSQAGNRPTPTYANIPNTGPAIKYGLIGDSRDAEGQAFNDENPPFDRFISKLSAREATRTFTGPSTNNKAIPGKTSAGFITGTTDGDAAFAYLIGTAHIDVLILDLGINDAQGQVNASTYETNMRSIAQRYINAGVKVALKLPTFREPGHHPYPSPDGQEFDETTTPYLLQYHQIMRDMASGGTAIAGVSIIDDGNAYRLTAEQGFEVLDDRIHETGATADLFADYMVAGELARIDSLEIQTPTFSPPAGAVTSGTVVTFSSSTSGVTFYSTSDGTTPTTASTAGSTRTVSSGQTIKAIAVKAGKTDSAVASATYTIVSSSTVTTPVFSPVAGSYGGAQSVTLTCATSGADIYYTDDGTTPTTSSNLYTSPLTISATTTLKAIAAKAGMTNSAVRTGTFTITSGGGNSATLEAKITLLLTMLGADGATATKEEGSNNLIEVFTYAGNVFTRTSPPDGSGFSTVYEEAAE